jgi:hypothetical protein
VERLVRNLSCHLPPVVLFYDDLERVIELIGSLDTRVSLMTDEYRLENLEELKQMESDRVKNLTIMADWPYNLHIMTGPFITILEIREVDPEARGVFEELKDFLTSKRKFNQWLVRRPWLQAGFTWLLAAVLCILLFVPLGSGADSFWLRPAKLTILSLYVIWSCIWLWTFFRRNTIIWLKKRSEYPSRWASLNTVVDVKSLITKIIYGLGAFLLGAVALYLWQHWK